MREISLIVVHCTDTPAKKKDGKVRDVTKADLHQWHVVENGWSSIGYHYLIDRYGLTWELVPHERPGIHAKGYNEHSLAIVLAGGKGEDGKAEDNFTPAQYEELTKLLKQLHIKYPKAYIKGHNELSAKACPSFDVQAYLKEIGL